MPSIGRNSSRSLLLERHRGSALPFSPVIDNGTSRRSCSYYKLPQQLLNLSILKLDGSCFDVQIARMASVAELKQAVEDVFIHSSKEDQEEISWLHVWTNFCFCYQDQKLVNDKDNIQSFGIKDGDQLHFIRHQSSSCIPRKRSKSSCKQRSKSLPGSDVRQVKEENGEDGDYGDDQEQKDKHFYCEEDDGNEDARIQSYCLTGWLLFSRLWCAGRRILGRKVLCSKFARRYLRLGSKVYDNRENSERDYLRI